MQRFVCRTLALLALVVLAVSPVMATDLDEPAPAPDTLDVPALECQLQERPGQTPVPAPEVVEQAADPALDSLLSISPCDNSLCPEGCQCVIVNEQRHCYC